MEFIIGKKIAQTNPKNKYAVEIELMHGDADLYTKEQVLIDATSSEKLILLEELVTLLNQLKKVPSGYSQKYESNELFLKWFSEDSDLTDEEYDAFTAVVDTFDWSGDKTCDGMYLAKLYSYKIFYYDQDGQKLNVKVKGV
jgi:hypothetical protein